MSLARYRRQFAAYGTRGVIVGGNFIVMILLAKLLSPSDYGRVVYLWSVALTFAAVGSVGAPAWLLRELSLRTSPEAGLRALNTTLVLILILAAPALVIGACAGAFALFHDHIASPARGVAITGDQILLIAVASWLINVINNLVNFPRIMGHISLPMAIRDAMPQCLLLAATLIALALGSATIHNIYTAFNALTLLFAVVASLLCCKFQPQAFHALDRSAPAERPNLFGFWGLSVVAILATNIDILIGGLFLSAADIGYYQLIKRIVNLASLPQIVVNWAVVVPVGRAFAERDFAAIQAAVAKASRMALMPLALLSLFVPFAAILVSVELGYGFGAADAWMLGFLLLGAIVNVLFGANFAVASQCALEYQGLIVRLGSVLGFCILTFALAATWPTTAMLGLCQLLLALVSNAWLWYAIWRKIGVDSSAASIIIKHKLRGAADQ